MLGKISADDILKYFPPKKALTFHSNRLCRRRLHKMSKPIKKNIINVPVKGVLVSSNRDIYVVFCRFQSFPSKCTVYQDLASLIHSLPKLLFPLIRVYLFSQIIVLNNSC